MYRWMPCGAIYNWVVNIKGLGGVCQLGRGVGFWFKVGKWEFITNDSNDKKNKDWYIGWANGADDFHFDKKINQVHLVQNLVYALTHKEI